MIDGMKYIRAVPQALLLWFNGMPWITILVLFPPTTIFVAPGGRHYYQDSFESFHFLGRFLIGKLEWNGILWPLWILEIAVGVGIIYFLKRKK